MTNTIKVDKWTESLSSEHDNLRKRDPVTCKFWSTSVCISRSLLIIVGSLLSWQRNVAN